METEECSTTQNVTVEFIMYFWFSFVCLWSAAIQHSRWRYTNSCCNCSCNYRIHVCDEDSWAYSSVGMYSFGIGYSYFFTYCTKTLFFKLFVQVTFTLVNSYHCIFFIIFICMDWQPETEPFDWLIHSFVHLFLHMPRSWPILEYT